MKICFDNTVKLSKESHKYLVMISAIVEDYQAKGFTLTLRQLYYQLVSKDLIPNKQAWYNKIGIIVKKGRLMGLIDWDIIEDRVRVPKLPYFVDGIEDAINDTINAYRLDRMRNQQCYIEVRVEKDALSSIFYRTTAKYGINLMVNRWYSSISAMYDASERFARNAGKQLHILYFGDHDPSGLDMIRDIKERMQLFGIDLEVTPCALTMEQIELYNPPPNPAKITDPRAGKYIRDNWKTSWELDALPPEVLSRILDTEIQSIIDYDKYLYLLGIEKEQKQEIARMIG